MNMQHPLIGGLLALAVTACATGTPPNAELAVAETTIQAAEDERADTLAAQHFRRANDHLAAAKAAIDKEEYSQARWAAEKATADAKLAETQAKTAKMKKMLAELNQTIAKLEQEMHTH